MQVPGPPQTYWDRLWGCWTLGNRHGNWFPKISNPLDKAKAEYIGPGYTPLLQKSQELFVPARPNEPEQWEDVWGLLSCSPWEEAALRTLLLGIVCPEWELADVRGPSKLLQCRDREMSYSQRGCRVARPGQRHGQTQVVSGSLPLPPPSSTESFPVALLAFGTKGWPFPQQWAHLWIACLTILRLGNWKFS